MLGKDSYEKVYRLMLACVRVRFLKPDSWFSLMRPSASGTLLVTGGLWCPLAHSENVRAGCASASGSDFVLRSDHATPS